MDLNKIVEDEYAKSGKLLSSVELGNYLERLREADPEKGPLSLVKLNATKLEELLNNEISRNNKQIIANYVEVAKYYGVKILGELTKEKDNTSLNETTETEDADDMGIRGIISKDVNVNLTNKTLNSLKEILDNLNSEDPQEMSKHTWRSIEDTTKTEKLVNCDLKKLSNELEINKTLLLKGVPGTGKTLIMNQLINERTQGDTDKYIITSFSQNTDYVDFIGGITSVNGNWVYKDGILLEIAKRADANLAESVENGLTPSNYYLGIDELSRGNTEAILGELMTAIEHRGTPVTMKNGETLAIPENLYIIGTMNITDGSTKRLDIATQERFYPVLIEPQWTEDYIERVLIGVKEDKEDLEKFLLELIIIMQDINNKIRKDSLLGSDRMIGTRSLEIRKETKMKAKQDFIISIKNRLIESVRNTIKLAGNKAELEGKLDDLERLVERYEDKK